MAQSVKESSEKPSVHDFKLGIQLGQGNFSIVVKATHIPTNEIFAIKVLEKQKVNRLKVRHSNIFNEIQMEKRVLNRLKHDNIIPLYQTFQDPAHLFFLMEYIEGGELWDSLCLDGKLVGCDEEAARFFMADIVNAMEYMKLEKVVHRDLKPENMLVSRQDKGHIKVVDFGTAKDLHDRSLNGPTFVGTPEYMSPETVNNQDVDCSSDLWALGCIFYQLLTGETPFSGGSAYLTFLNIQKGTYKMPEFISDESKDLIDKLLQMDPQNRIGAKSTGLEELKAHAFFDGIDFDSHMNVQCPELRSSNGHLFEIVQSSAKELKEKKALTATAAFKELCGRDRAHLMHIFKRFSLLHRPEIYLNFFGSPIEGRLAYAKDRKFIGNEKEMEGQWAEPFSIVHIANLQLGEANSTLVDHFRSVLRRLNELKPKFVVFGGNFTSSKVGEGTYEADLGRFKELLAELDVSIPMMFVCGENEFNEGACSDKTLSPYEETFGNDYYSFWQSGVKFININTSLFLDNNSQSDTVKAAKEWFKEEVENGKLCSQQMVVTGFNPWISEKDCKDPCVNESSLTAEIQSELLELMRTNGVRIALSSTSGPHAHTRLTLNEESGKTGSGQSDDEHDEPTAAKKEMHVITTPPFSAEAVGESAKDGIISVISFKEFGFEHSMYSLQTLPQSLCM